MRLIADNYFAAFGKDRRGAENGGLVIRIPVLRGEYEILAVS